MRYEYRYQPIEYGLGFAMTREALEGAIYFAKTYGLYRLCGRLRHRSYGREIKGGMSLFDAMQRCSEDAMMRACGTP